MRALIQRVAWAEARIGEEVVGWIDRGLLVYVGVACGDGPPDARRLAEKVASLRVFDDAEGKLNLSVRDVAGGVLAVSNFTLLADARKGRRPAFSAAARGTTSPTLNAVSPGFRILTSSTTVPLTTLR